MPLQPPRLMPQLFTGTGARSQITDAETDWVDQVVGWVDGGDLQVYVAQVDSVTGLWTTPAVPLTNSVNLPGGTALPLSDFPNGMEFALTVRDVRAYYSVTVAGTVRMFKSVDPSRSFTYGPPVQVQFPADGNHRFLVNCSYGEDLEDRLLFYIRSPSFTPGVVNSWVAGGEGRWCLDNDAPIATENLIMPVPTVFRVNSAPVRPVPNVYAYVKAELDSLSGRLSVSWVDLGAGGASLESQIHVYSAAEVSNLDYQIVGMGVQRAPNLGLDMYVAYVVLDVLEVTAAPARYTRVDTFLVRYSGRVGGTLAAHVPAAAQVQYGNRLDLADARVAVNRRYVIDDENVLGVDGNPYIVLLKADRNSGGGPVAPRELWVVGATPQPPIPGSLADTVAGGPGAVYVPPPLFTPLVEYPVTPLIGAPGAISWSEAEPMNVGSGIYCYAQDQNNATDAWLIDGSP